MRNSFFTPDFAHCYTGLDGYFVSGEVGRVFSIKNAYVTLLMSDGSHVGGSIVEFVLCNPEEGRRRLARMIPSIPPKADEVCSSAPDVVLHTTKTGDCNTCKFARGMSCARWHHNVRYLSEWQAIHLGSDGMTKMTGSPPCPGYSCE